MIHGKSFFAVYGRPFFSDKEIKPIKADDILKERSPLHTIEVEEYQKLVAMQAKVEKEQELKCA